MERLKVNPSTPVTKIFENGTKVLAKPVIATHLTPGDTAWHEAKHVVTAENIIDATIIPNGSVLGSVRPVKMTAISAVAPAADGHVGTGWDLFVTQNYLGVDPGSVMSAARSILISKSNEVEEVATMLQERGTIHQTDVNEARNNVKNRQEGIFPVEVTSVSSSGEVYSYETTSFHGEVVLPIDYSTPFQIGNEDKQEVLESIEIQSHVISNLL